MTSQRDAAGALLYLYRRTAANRLRRQVGRLRNPRYLVAMLLGILYLWWALFRNARLGEGPFASMVSSDVILPFLATGLLLMAAWWWLFNTERGALAFTPADVQFLFPAPVSRRTLVHAKLLRSQLAILINVLIWTVLLRGGGGASVEAWQRGLALWLLFSTLTLHRLGATLVRSNALEHAAAGRRRALLSIALFAAVLAAIGVGVVSQLTELRVAVGQGAKAVVFALATALDQPLPRVALALPRALLTPIVTAGGAAAAWGTSILAAIGVFALHYAWVVRMDSAFEEAALEASQHQAERLQRVRSSQMVGKSRTRSGKLVRIPRLALRGRPEVAIAWKNIAAALRGGQWRGQFIGFTIGLLVFGLALRRASASAADIVGGLVVGWAAMLLLIGPLWMRFDLRLDLRRLEILKALPISGSRLVAAEVAGVTVLHSLTVWGLLAVGWVLVANDPAAIDELGLNAARVISVVLLVPAINALLFTVHNATALLFPGWVRLGSEQRGFESMGQNLLTMGATTIVGAVALVFPVGLAALVLWLGPVWIGDWSTPLAAIVAAGILGLQLWPVLIWLGDVFDRLDVTEVVQSA